MSNEIDPLIYLQTASNPGVLVSWQKMSTNPVAFFQIVCSKTGIDGDYTTLVTLPNYITMWIDTYGLPSNYYKVIEIATDNSVAVTQPAIGGTELLNKATLLYEVQTFISLPVDDEVAIFSADRTKCRFTFKNWYCNGDKPEIRISAVGNDGSKGAYTDLDQITPLYSTQNDSDGNPTDNYPNGLVYQLDYQGNCFFTDKNGNPVAVSEFDEVMGSYRVNLFAPGQLNNALNWALQSLNGRPGTRKYRTVGSTPFWYEAALNDGATYMLLRQLILKLSAREMRLLFQDPGRESDTMEELKSSRDEYSKRWDDHLKNIPNAYYPQIAATIVEPYMMPGGRSRYFRALWKGNF